MLQESLPRGPVQVDQLLHQPSDLSSAGPLCQRFHPGRLGGLKGLDAAGEASNPHQEVPDSSHGRQ